MAMEERSLKSFDENKQNSGIHKTNVWQNIIKSTLQIGSVLSKCTY